MTHFTITPNADRIVLIATALDPIRHDDPDKQDDSNTRLFFRQKMLVKRDLSGQFAEPLRFDIPTPLASLAETLNPADIQAASVLIEFIRCYQGDGLMDGAARYRQLENRVRQAAVASFTMPAFWARLVASMHVEGGSADRITRAVDLTKPVTQAVLEAFANRATVIIALARKWIEHLDANSPTAPLVADLAPVAAGAAVIDVPSVSSNAVRSVMVRKPTMWHMLSALGIDTDDLPKGVQILLYNGGDLNKAQDGNVYKYIASIRKLYPALGLLGGSTDSFILGQSNLTVSTTLIASEYNAQLSRYGLRASVSAFDLLDHETLTRHASGRVDHSPMPFSFETLIAGTQFVIDFTFRPYATDAEKGALLEAVSAYAALDSTFGASAARGFGSINVNYLEDGGHPTLDEYLEAYRNHLETHGDEMREGLISGTLGTDKKVIS